jgi:thiol-disulfide isomerase/thioredoxin
MLKSYHSRLFVLFLAACALFWTTNGAIAANLGPPTKTIPNMTFRVLPNGTDAKAQITLVPMAQYQGKPIAIIVWKVGDTKSETELKAFQALAGLPTYKGKVHFLSAVKVSGDADHKTVIARARALKLTVPVILDRSQLSPYLEAWFAFPRYGLIDKNLKLRIWNCAKLSETVGPNMTFLKAVMLGASGKAIPTMRGIGKPKNTYELTGKQVPNVGLNNAKLKPTTARKYIKGKPTLICFWSVTCPHCRQVIPAVAKYWSNRKGNLDMVTITRAPSEDLRKQIRDLFKTSNVTWPVAYAPENATLSYFNIVKVPTVILTDKKGVIKYVWIQPDAKWIGGAIENAILKYSLF